MHLPTPKPKGLGKFEVRFPAPYVHVKKLGQGRFGSVHEVESRESKEHFAVKTLTFTCEEDFNGNVHEISKLQSHQHPNVVGFVDVLEGENAHFVVIELCTCSLQDKLNEQTALGTQFNRIMTFRWMRDILNGIAFLHSRDEVYGDLKPSNILIAKDGTAKLGDFGGVVGTGTVKTNNLSECGTMKFWAPEQFSFAAPKPSQAADMWAFGMVLLQLLTNREWVGGDNSLEILTSVMNFKIEAVVEKSGLSRPISTLLNLLLAKNPQERVSSGELLRTGRLFHILGEETPLSQYLRMELDRTETTIRIQNEEKVTKARELTDARGREEKLTIELHQAQERIRVLETELKALKNDKTTNSGGFGNQQPPQSGGPWFGSRPSSGFTTQQSGGFENQKHGNTLANQLGRRFGDLPPTRALWQQGQTAEGGFGTRPNVGFTNQQGGGFSRQNSQMMHPIQTQPTNPPFSLHAQQNHFPPHQNNFAPQSNLGFHQTPPQTQPQAVLPQPSHYALISPNPQIPAPQRISPQTPQIPRLSLDEQKAKGYFCVYSGQRITTPVTLEGFPNEFYEREEITKFIRENGIHPIWFDLIDETMIRPAPEKEAEIRAYFQAYPID
ncbi:putative Cyclin-dependent kinase 2 [Blattamonas nauphoetae]|uniref:Cyclin-dependent kinase 2 n=1 Tax=Blattamonas nauphoetae TaxID=2049346 RepID=A0ABQ9WUT5_9EUKA|nr:putative Cyclin-dependent kinase 2 [Blattamonas nauphoetae]